MYRSEHRHQLWLEDILLPFGGKLSGDNRWIKLAELIPWDELKDHYATLISKGFEAPANPFRMALGGLIIKARLGLRMKNWSSRSRKTRTSSSSSAWKRSSIRRYLVRQRRFISASAYQEPL